MALADSLIQRALDKSSGIRAGTHLQDALEKVKRSRKLGEVAFDIAIGELWVLAGDVYKERNGLKIQNAKLLKENQKLKDENRYLKEKGSHETSQ